MLPEQRRGEPTEERILSEHAVTALELVLMRTAIRIQITPQSLLSDSRRWYREGRRRSYGREETPDVRTSRLRMSGSEWREILQPLLREFGRSTIHRLRVWAHGVCCGRSGRSSTLVLRYAMEVGAVNWAKPPKPPPVASTLKVHSTLSRLLFCRHWLSRRQGRCYG